MFKMLLLLLTIVPVLLKLITVVGALLLLKLLV